MSSGHAIERAFEIARTGTVRNIDDIRRALRSEGCDNIEAHLSSLALKKQLLALIAERKAGLEG